MPDATMSWQCGCCPVSLLCHAGLIKEGFLCPKCRIYQVTVHDEETHDVVVHRIKCPVRYLDGEQYIDWCMESDEAGCGRDRSLDGTPEEDAEFNVMTALRARIMIPERGPPQRQTTNGNGFASTIIAVCNDCYGNAHVENVP